MLINVLLCDDDIADLQKLYDMLEKFLFKLPDFYNYHIDYCTTGNEFLSLAEKNIYQIAFLDIELPDISGLEAAKKLRNQNEDIIIVFVSYHDRYLRDILEVQPFRYLDKPLNPKLLENTCQAILGQMEKNKASILCIEHEKEKQLINTKDILFIDVDRKQKNVLCFHLTNNSTVIGNGTLRDYAALLEERDFVSPKKGYLVNLRFVKSLTANQIYLKDNTVLPLSRRQAKQVENLFANHILAIIRQQQ